eukprot:4948916-Prymnesium_polylepis.1
MRGVSARKQRHNREPRGEWTTTHAIRGIARRRHTSDGVERKLDGWRARTQFVGQGGGAAQLWMVVMARAVAAIES